MNIYIILLVIVCLLIVGSVLEDIFTFKEIKKISPPDTMMTSPKGNTFLYSKGNSNTTVIFLPSVSLTSPYCDFYNLQKEVAKFTKTALYESYGYGFSDDSKNYTSLDEYIDNLRYFLKRCGHTPPYIFVCHSTSSLQVLHYYKLYPKEVIGIIFEDAINPAYTNFLKIPPKIFLRIITFCKYTGIIRLLLMIPIINRKVLMEFNDKKMNKINKTLFIKNILNENILQEIYNIKNNSTLILKEKIDLEKIPIRIITSLNKNFFLNEKVWLESQEDMLTWSNNSSQIVVKNHKNFVHRYDKDIFIKTIKELLKTELFIP